MPDQSDQYIQDLLTHRKRVSTGMFLLAGKIRQRALHHDDSKFSAEEANIYEQVVPKLKTVEYGSDAYKEAVKELGPALEHHYQENSHHPEHFKDGISGMTLLDVIEMLCDWSAVSPDINKSLEVNKERFGIDEQLFQIIKNTLVELDRYHDGDQKK